MKKWQIAALLAVVALALMVPAVIYARTDVPMISALQQGQKVNSFALPGVTAVDPGGGASKVTIAITDDSMTVTLAGVTYRPNLGWESVHFTEPIDTQSGSLNNLLSVSIDENLTSALGRQSQNLGSVTIAIAGHSTSTRPASLQSACSQNSIDSARNLGALTSSRVNQTLNVVVQRTTPARINSV